MQYTLTISVNPRGGGNVSPEEGSFKAGATVTLRAAAAQNYRFISWDGAISGSQNPTSIKIDRNMTVIANSERPHYTLNTLVKPSGGGRVSSPGGTLPSGTPVTLWATAAQNYRFVCWGGDARGSQNPTNIIVDSNKTVAATFEMIQKRR